MSYLTLQHWNLRTRKPKQVLQQILCHSGEIESDEDVSYTASAGPEDDVTTDEEDEFDDMEDESAKDKPQLPCTAQPVPSAQESNSSVSMSSMDHS